jgi:hypothetical protein
MDFTAHALRRCDQRAIPRALVELIIKLGDEFKCGKGCRIITTHSKIARQELTKELQIIGLRIRKGWENAYVVIDGKGLIITAGHRTKRVKKEFRG